MHKKLINRNFKKKIQHVLLIKKNNLPLQSNFLENFKYYLKYKFCLYANNTTISKKRP